MDTIMFLLGSWIGLLIIPFWLLVVTILFIKQLSDDPKNPNKPYFFTAVEPGRAKAIMRGGKVRRYIMNYASHRFSRTGSDATVDDHWEVIKGDDPVPLFPTMPFSLWKHIFWPFHIRYLLSWFNARVGRFTGHVFVGIWPIQTLHIYKFTRKVQQKDATGRPMINQEGLPILEDSHEDTDHVRTRVFVWNVEGQAGETTEGLKVGVRGIANVSVINPQKALFGSDKWNVVLTSTILSSLASNIRTMSINQVLTVKNKAVKDELAEEITKEANEKLADYGLHIEEYQIVDFEAKLSPAEAEALTAEWRAERLKIAAKIEGEGRGQGRAAEISLVAKAIKDSGEEGRRAQELEALIRQADAAGKSGGVVILGGSNTADGTLAALLAEMKKQNRR